MIRWIRWFFLFIVFLFIIFMLTSRILIFMQHRSTNIDKMKSFFFLPSNHPAHMAQYILQVYIFICHLTGLVSKKSMKNLRMGFCAYFRFLSAVYLPFSLKFSLTIHTDGFPSQFSIAKKNVWRVDGQTSERKITVEKKFLLIFCTFFHKVWRKKFNILVWCA